MPINRDRLARVLCVAQGYEPSANETDRAASEVAALLVDIAAQGYAIVPEVPTEAMVEAWSSAFWEYDIEDGSRIIALHTYSAMIQAGREE